MSDNAKRCSTRIWSGKIFNLDVDWIRYPDGSENDFRDHTASRELREETGCTASVVEEMCAMIVQGEIVDAKTIIGALFSAGFRAQLWPPRAVPIALRVEGGLEARLFYYGSVPRWPD